MKRILALVLMAALWIGVPAAAAPAADSNVEAGAALEEGAQCPDPTPEDMLPAVDSVFRSMGADFEMPYLPKDPDFFWTALYLMCVNYGNEHPLYEMEGGQIALPVQAVQEYASALFFEYDDLLPIPELYEGQIVYDEENGRYLFQGSDMGDTYIEMVSWTPGEDGSLDIVADYKTPEGEILGRAAMHLVQNPYREGIVNPRFAYSIQSVGEGERD